MRRNRTGTLSFIPLLAMTKRKLESRSPSPKKKKKTDEKKSANAITSYFASPITTSSHVGLQSTSLGDASSEHKQTALLDAEQIQILHAAVHEEKSLFFTGKAGAEVNSCCDVESITDSMVVPCCTGTGKSVLLLALIEAMKRKYKKEPAAVAITASTGIAATNIGGESALSLSRKRSPTFSVMQA